MLKTIAEIAAGTIAGAVLVLWIYGERGRLLRKSTLTAMKASGLEECAEF